MFKKKELIGFGTAILLLLNGGSTAIAGNSPSVLTVQKLYRDFSWEAMGNDSSKNRKLLIEQPDSVLKKYFTIQLATLFVADRRCVTRTQEICALDFQPIWDSQDPEVSDLRIESGKNENDVLVQYRYPGDGKLVRMRYDLVKTDAGWRISDIHYQSGYSLLKILGGRK